MGKPDIDRIIYALKSGESLKDFLLEYGERIQKEAAEGLIKLPDRVKIEELLKKYQLEIFKNDLYYIASVLMYDSTMLKFAMISGAKESKSNKEMLQALKMLYESNNEELKIEIKHKHINESLTIQEGKLIHVITEAIKGEYLKNDEYILSGYLKPEEITGQSFGDYIGLVIDNSEYFRNKKGARTKHLLTGRIIDAIQRYLQEYTSLKAEKGIDISRGQALFIFDILEIMGLISQQINHKERNIRHILNKYREKEALKQPITKETLKDSLKKHHEQKEVFLSKVRNINKNK